jgi:hypothetical protein
MANHEEPIWDEYAWERFLQQQDRKTERYMELLEKYLDDPNRDQIIAREMGWNNLMDEDGQKWAEEVQSAFDEDLGSELEGEPEEELSEEEEGFQMHPLYQTSFAMSIWLDEFFEDHPELQNHPATVKLTTQTAIASAKLAAALSDDDADEIGMTIAYLKRALKAISNAMEGALQLQHGNLLSRERAAALQARLFQIRDGIISLMGDYRAQWRKRFGEC